MAAPKWKKRKVSKETVKEQQAVFLRSGYCAHPKEHYTEATIRYGSPDDPDSKTNIIQTLCGVCNKILKVRYH